MAYLICALVSRSRDDHKSYLMSKYEKRWFAQALGVLQRLDSDNSKLCSANSVATAARSITNFVPGHVGWWVVAAGIPHLAREGHAHALLRSVYSADPRAPNPSSAGHAKPIAVIVALEMRRPSQVGNLIIALPARYWAASAVLCTVGLACRTRPTGVQHIPE